MMTMNNQYSAASLYDGGWRAEDRDQLIEEYDLTAEEADEICKGLREIEEENMEYIIKRTETYEGKDMVTYMQESGFFGDKDTARRFADREDAEDVIELEMSDPVYDKSFMGKVRFEIEEV